MMALCVLLKRYFNASMDTREAKLELERFKWVPFSKGGNGMNVVTFRSHVEP